MSQENTAKNIQKHNPCLLLSLFAYIKNPDYDATPQAIPLKSKVWNIIKFWSFSIVVVIFFGWLSSVILKSLGYDQMQNEIINLIEKRSFVFLIFMAVIWAPIAEELTFRMALRYSPLKLGFSLSFLFFILFDFVLGFFETFVDKYIVGNTIMVAILTILFIIVFGFIFSSLLKQRCDREKITKFYRNNFRWIFYLSAFLFSSIHILNYYNFSKIWFAIPLLVLPQFLIALVLGYVRMNYGLNWSMFFHFFHNAIITIPVVILAAIPAELMDAIKANGTGEMGKLSSSESLLIIFAFFLPLVVSIFVIVVVANLVWSLYKELKSGCQINN